MSVMWRGKRFDKRTAAMLEEVAGRTKAYVRPTQGSYSTSVGASANTHAGGGAVDISCATLPEEQALEIVRVMREVGFAAWMRKPSEGNWPEHIHGIAIGCSDLSPAAARQVAAYARGLSGLASGARDRHAAMGIAPTTWEDYLATKDIEAKPPTTYTVKVGDTAGRIAQRHGLTLAALIALNPRTLTDPDVISPGEVLKVA